jgi:CheY-like chemotaxis protein
VLVVEDDPPLRSLLAMAMSRHVTATVVGSTAEALAQLQAHEFDVVLADLDLGERPHDGRPARDGLWLLEQARALRPGARRMLMSGADMPDSELVDAHVRKPFQPLQLARSLAE